MRSDENDNTESENSRLGRDGRTSMPSVTRPVTPVGLAPAAERRSFREAEKSPSDGLFDALISVKGVMEKILVHLNRNTSAVVQVGESVTDLSVAVETCMRLDRSTVGKYGSNSPTECTSASQGERQQLYVLDPHAAFKVYSRGMEAVRIDKPGDGIFLPHRRLGIVYAIIFQ